jgi:hypothetical protein
MSLATKNYIGFWGFNSVTIQLSDVTLIRLTKLFGMIAVSWAYY